MKRGAERQIQREDGDDPHAVDANGGADGASQASAGGAAPERVIRGLPKRKGLGGGTPAAASPASNPFSFGSPAPAPAPAASSAQPAADNVVPIPWGRGAWATDQPVSAPAAKGDLPGYRDPAAMTVLRNLTSQGSEAHKRNGESLPARQNLGPDEVGVVRNISFLDSEGSSSAPYSAASTSSDQSSSSAAEVSYLRNLRGLNHSLKSTLELAMPLDGKNVDQEFEDLAPVVEMVLARYKAKRSQLVKDREGKSGASGSGSGSGGLPVPTMAPAPPGRKAGAVGTNGVASAAKPEASTSAAKPVASTSAAAPAPAPSSSTGSFVFKPVAAPAPAPSKPAPEAAAPSTSSSTAPASTAASGPPKFAPAPAGGFSFGGKAFSAPPADGESGSAAEKPKDLPKFDLPKGGFAFGGKKVDFPAASAASDGKAAASAASDGKATAAAAKPSDKKEETAKASSPFAAPAASSKSTSSSPFSFAAPAASSGTSPFTSSTGFTFGSANKTTQDAGKDGDKSSASPAPAPAFTSSTGFGFGSSSSSGAAGTGASKPFSFGAGSTAFGSSTTPSTSFSFGGSGSSSGSAPSTGFSFANPATKGVEQPGQFDFAKAGGKIMFGGEKNDEEKEKGEGEK